MKRLYHLILVLLLASPLAWADLGEPVEGAGTVEIPTVRDLQQEGALAAQRRLPILLMFSSDYCNYCTILARDFLKPMLYTGSHDERIIIRMVKLGPGKEVRDFDGKPISLDALSDRYKVRVTPTLIFVDFRGKPMAEKMVGLSTPDFFGAYLEQAIDTAYNHVRGGSTFACKEAHTKLTC